MAKPAVVIVGAGHNGLITAFYLAKAGYKPIVLERRETVGGAAITEEFHPGFKCSTLAHAMGPLAPELMRAMKLKRHGLEWIRAEPAVTALHPDGRCLPLYADTTKSAEAIAKFSEKDARRYPEFQRTLHQVAGVLARTLTMTPPEIDSPSTGDIFKLLGTGRAFRKLGKKGMFRLLRWGPMAAADLVAEWFETELLRAVIAARGIFGKGWVLAEPHMEFYAISFDDSILGLLVEHLEAQLSIKPGCLAHVGRGEYRNRAGESRLAL